MPLWSRTSRTTLDQRDESQAHGTEEGCEPVGLKVPLLGPAPSFCTDRAPHPFFFLSGRVLTHLSSFFILSSTTGIQPNLFPVWEWGRMELPVLSSCSRGSAGVQQSKSKSWGASAGGDGAAHVGQWVLSWSCLSFLLPCQVPADLPDDLLVQGRSEHGTRGPRRGTKHSPHPWSADCPCSHLSWQHWDKEPMVSEWPFFWTFSVSFLQKSLQSVSFHSRHCLFYLLWGWQPLALFVTMAKGCAGFWD